MVILIKINRVSDINNFLRALVANRNVIGTLKKLIRTNFTEHQYWKVIINCAEHKNNHGRMITLSYNLTLQWLWTMTICRNWWLFATKTVSSGLCNIYEYDNTYYFM